MTPAMVSIVMPAYNGAGFIAEAIASVLAQSHQRWELLVVDDCSNDGTGEIARGLGAGDPRIRVLETRENSGSAAARNLGLRECGGRYVAFLDADDLWNPHKLARQLEYMRERAASFSFTAYRKFSAAGPGGIVHAQAEVSWRDMLKGNRIGCSTVVLDAQAFPAIAFPTGLGRQEDYALWLSLLRAGGLAHGLDEPLAAYRVHETSKSSRKLRSVTAQWQVYRRLERLSPLLSAWYLGHYAVRGVLKALR
jgi:teichuronic acid biosynthesis glycosyltransferase TuaG